ncbi:bifunctional mannitol-1-phosphate dehydrogenase/phosphatase [Acinetobacter baumannii]|uniref:bifunctional mannitol-1-phosphate dehydrogenase/phosphatase n=1 Tax=Acinetobacter baumannii TaxID=470 RepID=UPI0007A418D9|nr:HAD family hydrolase [Acinetobacter baumannii]EHU2142996.1 HAD-IA family hydrolase [Acinetobacter baumannii]EHU2654164.1 HAD-IA family hydrolase [Acinetobacter baumannii]EHU2656491.1 HAD-IA family hydrolase [Acinetobacter baumannii]EHU2722600.1 HAD-IA family hydrolase [Acinetobacter baumannii]EHU2840695.1 HAD-IA family hydrolase [Acinetobacter baumannii]
MLIFHGKPVHGAIFDMDGTMFDTERLRFQTLQQASQELIGQEFSHEYLMQCLGLSATTAEKLAQRLYGVDVPYKEIRKRADEMELEHIRKHGVPIKKGLVQVLERLRKSGLRMAVATSSRRAIAEEYLINANVYKFFDVITCGDEVEQGKPHPEIFLKAASQLHLDANQCLMFEDSENGLTSAHTSKGLTILLKDIKEPNDEMLEKAHFYYDQMYDFLTDLDQFIPVMDMPEIQEPFPQSLNQLTVGIHGFGAIGGGYIAQILSHWDGYTKPKCIIASTRNSLFREAVNAFGTYSIRYGQFSYDERIENMTIVDSDNEQQMLEMYTHSSLIALCLPEQAIESESKIIAKGLYARFNSQLEICIEPLTFLIILNKVGAKYLVMKHLKEALLELTNDEDVTEHILKEHYFCDTVVNRMVSKLSNQNLYRQLRIKHNFLEQHLEDVEQEDQIEIEDCNKLNQDQLNQASIYVDNMRRNFQPGHILQSMDLILFHSETDMPIYVEKGSPLLEKLRQVVLVDQITDIQLIKNRLWNGVHAMLAWYASLMGYESIGVAMGDHSVKAFAENLIAEVKQGLAIVLPNYAKDLDRMSQSFLDSCEYAFKDPCQRVARDPLRKLNHNERVMASIAVNIRHDLSYKNLVKGAALGYAYAIQFLEIEETKAVEHLQQQIQNLDLSTTQRRQLEAELVQLIQYLFSEQGKQPLDIKLNNTKTTSNQYV